MRDDGHNGFRFDLREANGALGDIGTLLPLTIATIAIVGLSAQAVLLGFGLFYIATGLIYRLPVPVQPMKAIAAVALVSTVPPGAIALSGVLIGLVLLFLGATGLIDRIARLVPQSVLSGLQLGLGLALAWIALGLIQDQWIIGGLTLAVASIALRVGAHAALLAIGAGIASGFVIGHPGWPELAQATGGNWFPLRIEMDDVRSSIADLALPQLALTLTNAVFLTAFVAQDSFGQSADCVTPRRLCLTSGASNLLCAPFGALPMCHGAGGLVAHHRFGARTGAAPLLIGAVILVLACLPAG
ncbi:putative sulfate/molybdate transporter [uncultured Jannaschia sp.]|uniref:putative sulfate/molybdate transporter n=1 Tax=uncultured Jannaschia sp. TaxID=293347 RepID=UPI00260F11FA|nr:putative sulfate/molybdate transporter [uncultured Jannaschia sp.]